MANVFYVTFNKVRKNPILSLNANYTWSKLNIIALEMLNSLSMIQTFFSS